VEEHRFSRSELLFGREGQEKIQCATVAVVGVGGLGTHVVQQLALLGVGRLHLVDHEELSDSNRNRYVGARHDDPVPGLLKVDLGERLAHEIDPSITVQKVNEASPGRRSLAAVKDATHVFGCLDNDGVRFVLNETCQAYEIPLFDLASGVPEEGRYGGRVTVVRGEGGCLHCRGLLDDDEVRRFLSAREARENEDFVYGVSRDALDVAGPSVVSINGVVASLGVTEFMVFVTGMRPPAYHLTYTGHNGKVSRATEDPSADCYYCQVLRGKRDAANIERYLGPPTAEIDTSGRC
jgi:molybdopterin/thiamine biosynthesis adenylyltransferase